MNNIDKKINFYLKNKNFKQAEILLLTLFKDKNAKKYHYLQYLDSSLKQQKWEESLFRFELLSLEYDINTISIPNELVKAFLYAIENIDEWRYEKFFILLKNEKFCLFLAEYELLYRKKFLSNQLILINFINKYIKFYGLNKILVISLSLLNMDNDYDLIFRYIDDKLNEFTFDDFCIIYSKTLTNNKLKIFNILNNKNHKILTLNNIFTLCILSTVHDQPISIEKVTYFLVNLKPNSKVGLNLSKAVKIHLVNTYFKNKIHHKKKKEKTYNIALCISGQLRGYDKSLKTYSNLIKNYSPDIFISTWENIGYKEPTLSHAHRVFSGEVLETYKNMLINSNINRIKEEYPELFKFLNSHGNISKKLLKKEYNTPYVNIEKDDVEEFSKLNNPEKMYYKIFDCFNMAVNSNKEYDIIIRIRPDKPFSNVNINWEEIFNDVITDDVIYVDNDAQLHPSTKLVIGDQFAIGSYNIMKTYSTVWATDKMLKKVNLPGSPMRPHNSLAYRMWMSGIKIKSIPAMYFANLQNTALSAKKVYEKVLQDAENRMNENDIRLLKSCNIKKDILNDNIVS